MSNGQIFSNTAGAGLSLKDAVGFLGFDGRLDSRGYMAADWIRDLELTESQTQIRDVIEKALVAARLGSSSAQCFLFNCYLAFNPYHVYDSLEVPISSGPDSGCENPWGQFWGICEGLRTSSIPGDDTRVLHEVMKRFDSGEWNGLARRVLLKDLSCGLTVEIFNSVCGNSPWAIPKLRFQQPIGSHQGHFQASEDGDSPFRANSEIRIEPYVNGERILALITSHDFRRRRCVLYDGQGKDQSDLQWARRLSNELANSIGCHRYPFARNVAFVLDGVVSHAPVMTHPKTPPHPAFYVFDILPLKDLARGYCNIPLRQRDRTLQRLVQDVPFSHVRKMPGLSLTNLATPQNHAHLKAFALHAQQAGHSQIMIKFMDAPYECCPSSSWRVWPSRNVLDLEQVFSDRISPGPEFDYLRYQI